jgi:hypothetical protein
MFKKLVILMLLVLPVSFSVAAERKKIEEVNIDAFTKDTQVAFLGSGDQHVAFAWWVPNEFWESILSRDETTSESNKKSLLGALSGITLIAVVQADISNFGAFTFYQKAEVEKSMSVNFINANQEQVSLKKLEPISPDLEVVLATFKPILGAAMGNLGTNLHFYVYEDKLGSDRLVDPYEKGELNIKLAKRDGSVLESTIETPLNALYVPRKCPNGKDAHVSWSYCPWSGEKLDQ